MSFEIRTRHRLPVFWPVGVLLILAGTPAPAQVVLFGTVTEEDGATPIPIAEVRLLSPAGAMTASTLSDDEGEFRLEAPAAGAYTIAVRRVGFLSVRAENVPLVEENETEVRVLMGLMAVPLEAVTVVARPNQPLRIRRFRERAAASARMGRGRIYMREDIERIRPISAEHLLAGALWGPGCRPEIRLDGVPVDGRLPMVTGDELEGVELYRGATQIPIEFYRPGMCGLALIWSRADIEGKPFTWRRALTAGVLLLLMGIASR